MGLSQKEIQLVEKPKQNNETNNMKMKSLNGYGATRERLDEHSTLTVNQPVVVNEKPKTKVSIVLNLIGYSFCIIIHIVKNYGALSSK